MTNKIKQSAIAENTFQVLITLDDVFIDKKEIAYALGYIDGILPPHFDDLIDGVVQQSSALCKIQTGYRLLNITKDPDNRKSLHIGGIQFTTQQIVTSQLRSADQAIVFLCSLGPGMELWAKQVTHEGDPALSYFIDAVASVLVETGADVLHDYLKQNFSTQDLHVTNRYSPGYCDWPVEEQKKLFSLLPEGFCGVSLTDSALMIPIKSISGIIGIGEKAEYKQYLCDDCGRKDCTYKMFREKSSKMYIKGKVR